MLLLVCVGAATVWGVRDMERSGAWVAHTYQVIERIQGVESALYEADASARGYRLTGHPALLADAEAALPAAAGASGALVAITRDNPAQQQRAVKIRDTAGIQLVELQRLLDIQKARGPGAAIEATRIGGSVERSVALRSLIAAMRDAEQVPLDARSTIGERSSRLLMAFVVAGLLLSLGVLWLLLWSLAAENRRSRQLEREARDAIARLEDARALGDRLSEQRRGLSVYAGLLQSCQNLDEAMEVTADSLHKLVPEIGGRCYVARASRDYFESAAHSATSTSPAPTCCGRQIAGRFVEASRTTPTAAPARCAAHTSTPGRRWRGSRRCACRWWRRARRLACCTQTRPAAAGRRTTTPSCWRPLASSWRWRWPTCACARRCASSRCATR